MRTTPQRAAVHPAPEVPPDLGLSAPWTTDERIVHIQALGQRIDRHIRFICAVGDLGGTSREAKDKAVAVFYERLLSFERQLERIHQDLELG